MAQDSKALDKQNLQPDFKKDFERQLQKKTDEKSNSLKDNKKDPKAQNAKKSETILRKCRSTHKIKSLKTWLFLL